MSDLGQDLVTSFIQHAWDFFKQESEVHKVSKMTSTELAIWRQKEIERIQHEATRIAGVHSDKELKKLGTTRVDSARKYEVLMRNDRGLLFSQFLLEGMDVRGLDMSKFRKGSLNQRHIDRAIGDRDTKLPPDIARPPTWGE